MRALRISGDVGDKCALLHLVFYLLFLLSFDFLIPSLTFNVELHNPRRDVFLISERFHSLRLLLITSDQLSLLRQGRNIGQLTVMLLLYSLFPLFFDKLCEWFDDKFA